MRPVVFVPKTISLPSGDHDAPVTLRLKKRSSIGTGAAFALRGDVTEAGSVMVRSSGERAKTKRSEARDSPRTASFRIRAIIKGKRPGSPGVFNVSMRLEFSVAGGFALAETFTVAVWLFTLPHGFVTRTQYDVVSFSAEVVKFADVPPGSGKFESPLAPVNH